MHDLSDEHERRLRHALRGLRLDERDERSIRWYARTWDDDRIDVVTGWIEQARTRRPAAGTTKDAPRT